MATFKNLIERLNRVSYEISMITFADKRSDLLYEIRNHRVQLAENLALIFTTNTDTLNHWKQEIWSNLSTINGRPLKGRGVHYLKEFDYFENFWSESQCCDFGVAGYKDLIEDKFKIENIELTDEMVDLAYTKSELFYEWLSKRLTTGKVPSSELYQKLDEIKAIEI